MPGAGKGGELDGELCMLYKLLNQECQQLNNEKKARIVERSARKGKGPTRQEDVNLLELNDSVINGGISTTSADGDEEDEDVSSDDDDD